MTSKNSLRSWRRDELLSATKNKISDGAKRHEIGERPVLLAQGSRFQGNFLRKKDFLMRIKICRKEAKESRYWLSLIDGLEARL